MFTPLEPDGTLQGDLAAKIQQGIGTVAVMADCAHGLGASRVVKHVPGGSNGVILTAIGTDAGILETATDTANSAGVQTTAAGTSAGVSATAANQTSTGRLAHFTSFSFHAVKNFTTAEGGAATWCLPQSVYDLGVTDAEIYKMYQLMSLHGQSKDALAKTNVGAWEYDIVGPWYKCNMTDIMAAIGLKQLDRYPGLLDRRKQIIKKYDKTCDELGLDHLTYHADGIDSSNHLYLVRIPGGGEEQRNDIIKKMAENGVSTNVHYKPLPMMTAYRELGHDIADFPNAYDYYHNLFTLPLHTLLTDEDVERVRVALRVAISE
ncbi:MAG: DegT/DnrJ/EryC1/StrS family aminotransferase [Eubacterium sp.]|nr:DegT/DnrJ/EryC1/StrS family aminotransferase [Eubacterium sp.]